MLFEQGQRDAIQPARVLTNVSIANESVILSIGDGLRSQGGWPHQLVGTKTIDVIQRKCHEAERESMDEVARLVQELAERAKEIGKVCNDVE
jgi:hypothetical protein